MLANIHPPKRRKDIAVGWLSYNRQQCSYGNMIYIRNQGPLTLGTAWDADVWVLTWDLQAPTERATQAIKKKRVL